MHEMSLYMLKQTKGNNSKVSYLLKSKVIYFHMLHTTAYHSQCNSLVVNLHKTIKTAMIVCRKYWLSALPIVLFGIHSIPNSSDFSPFYAVTGTQMLQLKPLIVSTNEEPVT